MGKMNLETRDQKMKKKIEYVVEEVRRHHQVVLIISRKVKHNDVEASEFSEPMGSLILPMSNTIDAEVEQWKKILSSASQELTL